MDADVRHHGPDQPRRRRRRSNRGPRPFTTRARSTSSSRTRAAKRAARARQFLTPYGVEFVEMPELKRLYIFDIGGPHTFRTVYMDGRSHPARSRAELLRSRDRLVGRRHARRRQHGLQRELLARPPRHAAHDAAAHRRALHAQGLRDDRLRDHGPRSRRLHRRTGPARSTCSSSAASSCSSIVPAGELRRRADGRRRALEHRSHEPDRSVSPRRELAVEGVPAVAMYLSVE